MANLQSPETAEIDATTEPECDAKLSEKCHKDFLLSELQEKLYTALSKNEKLQEEVCQFKERITDLEHKYMKLEERLFCLKTIAKNDSLVTFYTGFPNYKTMMALYEFLDPGASGENIKFWSSGREDIQTDTNDKQVKQGRPRPLKPKDDFFLTLCRLRQGFAELHLAQLYSVSVNCQ